MDKVKKAFLRTCINNGAMPVDKAEAMLTTLYEAYGTDNKDIKELVSSINTNINQFNQQLSFFIHPLYDGPNKEFLVFAYTFETDASKLQMHYTELDRYYFYKLMELAMKEDDYGVLWTEMYDIIPTTGGADKKLSKQKMQELVQKWTVQGYFIEKGEKLHFGPRMIVEYGTHLKLNYPDLMPDCPLCNKLVLWDIRCKECGVKLHRECIRTFLTRKSNCPSCKKTWNTRLSF